MQEESIYNLIPKEYVPPPQQPRYISKYPSDLQPTASTFLNRTTSRPNVANMNGQFVLHKGPHKFTGLHSTFGKPIGYERPNPETFLKTQKGTMKQSVTRELCEPKHKMKEPIPKDKPIMGLRSNKNFIVANAVENILAPAKVQPEPQYYVFKKDYGTTPNYLQTIKQSIQNEYNQIQQMYEDESLQKEKQKHLLSQEEIDSLKEGLKKKWDAVNKEYQTITHTNKIDTIGLKRKKEECEKSLSQIERDLEKLNKKFIFVDTEN